MVVVADRLTKVMAVSHLSDGSVQPVIPGVVDFLLVYNRGAAWGILEGGRLFFVLGALLACALVVLFVMFTKRHSTLGVLALGLFIGGAIGNAIDRALSGEVVDFIHLLFIEFPLFNVADSSITIGVVFLFLYIIFGNREKIEPKGPAPASPDDEASVTKEPS
jgi:signal peptidase II